MLLVVTHRTDRVTLAGEETQTFLAKDAVAGREAVASETVAEALDAERADRVVVGSRAGGGALAILEVEGRSALQAGDCVLGRVPLALEAVAEAGKAAATRTDVLPVLADGDAGARGRVEDVPGLALQADGVAPAEQAAVGALLASVQCGRVRVFGAHVDALGFVLVVGAADQRLAVGPDKGEVGLAGRAVVVGRARTH